MAQRDYVSRGQSAGTRRKKSYSRKKRELPAVSPAMVAIAAAVLVTFIGGLYFIVHHKKEDAETLPTHKVTGNGLPPKPEERWRYIKELENRQPGVRSPTEPSAGGEVQSQSQLTDEQRQLLDQMQADMRQAPTQLNEVPWNEQTPEQRQHTLMRQQMLHQQQWANQETTQVRTQQPYQQPRTIQPQTQTQTRAAVQPYQDAPVAQTRAAQPVPPRATQAQAAPAPKTQLAPATAPVSRDLDQVADKPKDEKRWMVQCGSFKGSEQAETVRAQLAFEGFDAKIKPNNGWNRVVIGPLKGKDNADGTINKLKMAGHGNCIRLSVGG